MYKKIFFQFILLIILFFILWYIFYFYLREDSKIIELSNNNIENSKAGLTYNINGKISEGKLNVLNNVKIKDINSAYIYKIGYKIEI